MGRHPNPGRKDELLDDIVDYLLEEGISDLSLRPLATALGTSTYTIAYQFGSKDEMLLDALAHIVEKNQQRNRKAAALATDGGALIESYWSEDNSDVGSQWHRLLLEVAVVAARRDDVGTELTEALVHDRLSQMQHSLSRSGVPFGSPETWSTVMLAILNGLAIDRMTTGDDERIDGALDWLQTAVQYLPTQVLVTEPNTLAEPDAGVA